MSTLTTAQSPAPLHRNKFLVLAAFLCAVISATAVNFLGAIKVPSVPPTTPDGTPIWVSPFAINGSRTLLAGAILLLPAILLGVRMRLSSADFWRYALIATTTMAIPQSLIFLGLQILRVTPTTVAFVESALIGIVFVYLLRDPRKRITKTAVIAAVCSILGLALFLGVTPQTFPLTTGDFAILGATVVTGVGLILADKLVFQVHDGEKAKKSLRKTFFTCLIAGVEVLVAVGLMNLVLGGSGKPSATFSLPALVGAWKLLLMLAVVGSIMTWFSIFLLIAWEQLPLAAAVVAAIPVTTEIANRIWFAPTITSSPQWAGGVLVLASLSVLILVQLTSKFPTSPPSQDAIRNSSLPTEPTEVQAKEAEKSRLNSLESASMFIHTIDKMPEEVRVSGLDVELGLQPIADAVAGEDNGEEYLRATCRGLGCEGLWLDEGGTPADWNGWTAGLARRILQEMASRLNISMGDALTLSAKSIDEDIAEERLYEDEGNLPFH